MELVGVLGRSKYGDSGGLERTGEPASRKAYACGQSLASERLVIVHGGQSENAFFGDTWRFDCLNHKWKHMVPRNDNVPCARAMHTLTPYLPHRFLMFGGISEDDAEGEDYIELDDLWEYDFRTNSWTLLDFTTGEKPPKRGGHSAVYGMAADGIPSLFILGGETDAEDLGNVYRLNLKNWKWSVMDIIGDSPPERVNASVCFMTSFNGLLVTCGQSTADYETLFDDVWILTLINNTWKWDQLILDGDIPPRLGGSIFLLPSAAPKVLLWGGLTAHSSGEEDWLKEVTVLDINERKSSSFSPVYQNQSPTLRVLHGAFRCGRDFFVWGGIQPNGTDVNDHRLSDGVVDHFKLDHELLYNIKKDNAVTTRVERVDNSGCLLSAVMDNRIFLSHIPIEAMQGHSRVLPEPAKERNLIRAKLPSVPKDPKPAAKPSEKIIVTRPGNTQSMQKVAGKRKIGSEQNEKKLVQGVLTSASSSAQVKPNSEHALKRRRISNGQNQQHPESHARASSEIKSYLTPRKPSPTATTPRKRNAAGITVQRELASGNNVLQKPSRTSGGSGSSRSNGLLMRKSGSNHGDDAVMSDVPIEKRLSSSQQQTPRSKSAASNGNIATLRDPSISQATAGPASFSIPLTGLQKQIAKNPLAAVTGLSEKSRKRIGTTQPRVQQPTSIELNARPVNNRENTDSIHRPSASTSTGSNPSSILQVQTTLLNTTNHQPSGSKTNAPSNKLSRPSAIAPPRKTAKSSRASSNAAAVVQPPGHHLDSVQPPFNALREPSIANHAVIEPRTTSVGSSNAGIPPVNAPTISAPSFGVSDPSAADFRSPSVNSRTNLNYTEPIPKPRVSAIAPPKIKSLQETRRDTPDVPTVSNRHPRPQPTAAAPGNSRPSQVPQPPQNNNNSNSTTIPQSCGQQGLQPQTVNRSESAHETVAAPSARRPPPTRGEMNAMAHAMALAQQFADSSDDEEEEE